MTDLRHLIDMSPSGSTSAAQGRDPFAEWHTPKGTRRPRPRRRRVQSRRKATPVQRHRRYAVTQLADADRRQSFKQIERSCRAVLGRCWRGRDVTPEQRDKILSHVAEALRRDGIRVYEGQLALRLGFWIANHDPTKALWFTIYDVAHMAQIIASRLPAAELRQINEQHRDQLDGRLLDYQTLASVCVAVAKNSLTHNHKTRREECGADSLIRMLSSMGISANGGLIRVSREILVRLNLIRCIDPTYFTKGMYGPGKCQRWVPCGTTWSLPFLSEIKPEELTEAQREEYQRYHNPRPCEEVSQSGHYHRMVSLTTHPLHPHHPEGELTSPFTPVYHPFHDHPEAICLNEARYESFHQGDAARLTTYTYDPAHYDHRQD